MENQESKNKSTRNAKVILGIFIILYGLRFLLNRIGVNTPEWIASWEIIIIGLGLANLYEKKCRRIEGYLLIIWGATFLVDDIYPHLIDLKLLVPIFIIALGVLLIGTATNLFQKKKTSLFIDDDGVDFEDGDYIEGSTIFGSVKKNVVSKNFQGGSLTTIFGGTELNLTKADIQGPVVIDSTVVFGGLKIFIPATWNVIIESNAMFGGVEDKRQLMNDESIDPKKTITLTGKCVFGGVEVQNFF